MKPHLLALDEQARQRALCVSESFLMQAPAGSGKTEVLTQRFLALLAIVDHPEHILALTFTKKAAAQMRHRVLQALHLAGEPAPTGEPELSRWQLAQAVLARDQQKKWHLLSSPNRLRLYTIDSLCATIVKQSPLAIAYAGHTIVPDAQPLYAEAALQVMQSQQGDWLEPLGRVLAYFNTDYGYFQKRLEQLLMSRFRWLLQAQVIIDGVQQQRFSTASVMTLFQQQLEHLQLYAMEKLAHAFSEMADWDEFWSLAVVALAHLGIDLPIALQPHELQLNHWQQLSQILVKQDGHIRQQLNKNTGFPATDKEKKKRMLQLLLSVSQQDNWPEIQYTLQLIKSMPQSYTDDPQHWLTIDVFHVACAAAQALEQIFMAQRKIDYAGLAQSAFEALGESLMPSDVLLRFDYQIQHILMDEFQDTSSAQLQLFERMVSGWQPGDGRSLFFVGDPMQSIYGFRDADVNLFYTMKHQGLAHLSLEFLQLRRNFRTQPQLVNILGQVLAPLFPRVEDALLHQVTFATAVAAKQHNQVEQPLIAQIFATAQQEASWVVEQIQRVLATTQGSIAIVVRKKSHVPLMTKILREQSIAYTAVALDPLWAFTSVRDLFHLVAVLQHTPQSYHFLAVCRSPWVGLNLTELEILSHYWPQDPGLTRWLSAKASVDLTLGQAAQNRVHQLLKAVAYFKSASELTLVEQVKGLWMSLLGPELTPVEALQPVAEFWQVLAGLKQNTTIALEQLQHTLERANTSVIDVNARVEIMTIHKAKGLEFATVFVPCLQDLTGRGEARLLEVVHVQLGKDNVSHTLFGVHQTNDKTTAQKSEQKSQSKGRSVAMLLKKIQQQREYNELARLFYVAVTRAEQQVYLSAVAPLKTSGEIRVAGTSLLGRLLPYFSQADDAKVIDNPMAQVEMNITAFQSIDTATFNQSIKGIAFQPLLDHEQKARQNQPSQQGDYWPKSVLQTLAARVPQYTGQLIHLWLAKIEPEHLQQDIDWRCWFHNMLLSYRWCFEQSHVIVERCLELVQCMLQDQTLIWLIKPRARQWREHAWQSGERAQALQAHRPDLVFFDEPTQKLWIIDFKTKYHQQQQSQSQMRSAHGPQLKRYAALFQEQGYNSIELGLYQLQPNAVVWHHWPLDTLEPQ